ncbi:MAG: dimethyl sulfoxide reductase anchor subunit [Burkholderiales bacterium]|nr:dimethyl sulfoxide reductase anchor subunit [Burkholderiales bacterium]
MRPAFSVIFLTTLIGAGQGLFVALYSAEYGASLGLWAMPSAQYFSLGCVLVLALLGAGLAASFFHLGRPERAWRSASMWRTSWLSREVIVLPVFMAAVAAFGLVHHLRGAGDLTLALGGAGVVLALLLFVCTGMIYACLPFLQEWHTPLTVINYLLLGCTSGFLLSTAWAAAQAPALLVTAAAWTAGATLAALVMRGAALARNARLRPKSTVQTAIGVKHPRIAQKAQGFMGGSFNTRDFFHGKSISWLRLVKWGFLLLVFPLPLALLAAGAALVSWPILAAAFALQYLGLLAERWYFFAQARHPQNLYYQAIS